MHTRGGYRAEGRVASRHQQNCKWECAGRVSEQTYRTCEGLFEQFLSAFLQRIVHLLNSFRNVSLLAGRWCSTGMAPSACQGLATTPSGCGTWGSSGACRRSQCTRTRCGRCTLMTTSAQSSAAAGRGLSTGGWDLILIESRIHLIGTSGRVG